MNYHEECLQIFMHVYALVCMCEEQRLTSGIRLCCSQFSSYFLDLFIYMYERFACTYVCTTQHAQFFEAGSLTEPAH